MSMITQNNDIIQALSERVVAEIPIVQDGSDGAIYILMKDLPEKTTKFIQGEEFEGMEVPVLPEEYEKIVVMGWRSRGFKCTYCRQSMEYMERDAIIRYLHVMNPETGVSIFLIPWFMLPRKKYPVQIYAYAAWYSSLAEVSAGVCETAEVVKELFGLETFDPSTVRRTKAQMSQIFRQPGENDGALSNQEPEIATTEAIIDWVTKVLEKQTSDESIKYNEVMNATENEVQPTPSAAEDDGQTSETQRWAEKVTDSGNNKDNGDASPGERAAQRASDDSVCARVLGSIPRELSEVKKPKPRAKCERRVRAPRERGERLRAKHKEIDFIESDRLKTKRNEFTRNCKNIVFNAALQYHKLLN